MLVSPSDNRWTSEDAPTQDAGSLYDARGGYNDPATQESYSAGYEGYSAYDDASQDDAYGRDSYGGAGYGAPGYQDPAYGDDSYPINAYDGDSYERHAYGHDPYGSSEYASQEPSDTARVSDGYAQSAMRDSYYPEPRDQFAQADEIERPSRAAAVLKRNDARAHRDLFAARDDGYIDSYEKHETAPPPSMGLGGTGARNENSVLFSLSELAKRATDIRPSRKPVPPPTAAEGHSGIIDLKAMMIASKGAPRSEPPLAVTVPTVQVPAQRSRTRVFFVAALGAALALVAVFGLRVALFPIDEEPMDTSIASTPAMNLADAANLSTPAPAKPAASASASAAASAAPATSSSAAAASNNDDDKKAKSHRHHVHKASTNDKAVDKAEKAPPLPNDPCHCGGNLQCAMRCST